ncbi:MAG: hypothetical protein ACI9BK_003473 [Acidimicrobiales bacterium]|jgi:hypothetical protein
MQTLAHHWSLGMDHIEDRMQAALFSTLNGLFHESEPKSRPAIRSRFITERMTGNTIDLRRLVSPRLSRGLFSSKCLFLNTFTRREWSSRML